MLFTRYMQVMKEYGELARLLPKKLIYEETAKPFFISGGTAARIIRSVFRNKDYSVTLTELEVQEYFKDMGVV